VARLFGDEVQQDQAQLAVVEHAPTSAAAMGTAAMIVVRTVPARPGAGEVVMVGPMAAAAHTMAFKSLI